MISINLLVIISRLESQRLRWARHVDRVEENEIPKREIEYKIDRATVRLSTKIHREDEVNNWRMMARNRGVHMAKNPERSLESTKYYYLILLLSSSSLKSTLIDLMERNANHIIPSYCYLPASCRSLTDRCGSLGSCKPQI